jgi:hypothetical protein
MMSGQQPQYKEIGSTIVSQQEGQHGHPGKGICSTIWLKRNQLYLLISNPVMF